MLKVAPVLNSVLNDVYVFKWSSSFTRLNLSPKKKPHLWPDAWGKSMPLLAIQSGSGIFSKNE